MERRVSKNTSVTIIRGRCANLISLDADDAEYTDRRRFILLIINNICVDLRSSSLFVSHEYRYLTHLSQTMSELVSRILFRLFYFLLFSCSAT